jgi:large subunit ribosomal protein L10
MNQSILNAKMEVVNEIQGRFEAAQSAVVVEYRGLSVAQMMDLRRKLREENIELEVFKNSMAQRAATKAGFDDLTTILTGPNAIAFSNDAVAPSRVLTTFAKKNKALIVKGGMVEGQVVDADKIVEIAKLPNKAGMIAMLLGCLQSPVRSFAATVKAVADAKAE